MRYVSLAFQEINAFTESRFTLNWRKNRRLAESNEQIIYGWLSTGLTSLEKSHYPILIFLCLSLSRPPFSLFLPLSFSRSLYRKFDLSGRSVPNQADERYSNKWNSVTIHRSLGYRVYMMCMCVCVCECMWVRPHNDYHKEK